VNSNQRVNSNKSKRSRALLISLFLSSALADIGCQHIGPKTVLDDRLAYNRAILTSWEQQALLNIVRARYNDVVAFVDVGSVVQSHSLTGTTQASFGASILPHNYIANTLTPALTGSRATTDSPTITYTPLTGSEFIRNLNRPIKPSDIFNLIESGYPAGELLPMTLRSISEIHSNKPVAAPNGQYAPKEYRDVNLSSLDLITRSSDFIKLAKAIECAHECGDLNFYGQASTDSDASKVFMIISDKSCDRSNESTSCGADPVAFIRKTLQLKPASTQFEIVVRPHRTDELEIAVQTRSVIAAMRWLSDYVQVPDAHIRAGIVLPSRVHNEQRPPLNVQWSVKKPRGVFAAVQYQGYWFSIPQNDTDSKFSLICLRSLLALADTAAKPPPPVLTIPTR